MAKKKKNDKQRTNAWTNKNKYARMNKNKWTRNKEQ